MMIIRKIKDIYLGEGSYGVVTKCKNRDTGQVISTLKCCKTKQSLMLKT